MVIGWQAVLAVAAVLFLVFLIVRVRPRGPLRGRVREEVRAARRRATEATTPRAQAEALCEAGTLALRDGPRWNLSAGLFLRAMKADPAWAELVEIVVRLFRRRRPRLLEKILWRRLSNTVWDDDHRAVLLETLTGLALLYERELRDRSRATVFRRLLEVHGGSSVKTASLNPSA